MKNQAAISMISSWLGNIHCCQIINDQWQNSLRWDNPDEKRLEELISVFKIGAERNGITVFRDRHDIRRIVSKANIDLVGMQFGTGCLKSTYGVLLPYNEYGLNYGDLANATQRIWREIISASIGLYVHFYSAPVRVLFISPKMNNDLYQLLRKQVVTAQECLNEEGIELCIDVISNVEFQKNILIPLIELPTTSVSQGDLFIDTLKIIRTQKQKSFNTSDGLKQGRIVGSPVEAAEMIKSRLVRFLREYGDIVEDSIISNFEREDYSKEELQISFPLLKKAIIDVPIRDQCEINGSMRYWPRIISIKGCRYLLFSDWKEWHRSVFEKWYSKVLGEYETANGDAQFPKPYDAIYPEKFSKKIKDKQDVFIVAYYLSKYEYEDVFPDLNQTQAIARFAEILGVKFNTLKSYRDRFDRYTGSHRKGWDGDMVSSMEPIYKTFATKSKDEVLAEINRIINDGYEENESTEER